MSITFACVFVRGYVGYSSAYVRNLASMVRRNYEGECTIACLTDQPRAVAEYVDEVHVVDSPPHSHPWWAKVELFNPERFTGRMCYLDLDVLVWRNLNVVTDYPSAFALVPHAGKFEGKGGLKVVKRFNSSVMVWDAGECDSVYNNWSPSVRDRLWGDQDWIGERRPDAAAMPAAWFPRLSSIAAPPYPDGARVVLCKKPKNVEAAARWPWFREAWA